MHKKEIEIDGITYTVGSTTPDGLKKAISSLKRSIKREKKQKEQE